MEELLEQAETIVAAIRSQNWKNGGCLSIDHPEAVAAVQQLVRTAYSAGQVDGARGMGDSMLETFDNAMASK